MIGDVLQTHDERGPRFKRAPEEPAPPFFPNTPEWQEERKPTRTNHGGEIPLPTATCPEPPPGEPILDVIPTGCGFVGIMR